MWKIPEVQEVRYVALRLWCRMGSDRGLEGSQGVASSLSPDGGFTRPDKAAKEIL